MTAVLQPYRQHLRCPRAICNDWLLHRTQSTAILTRRPSAWSSQNGAQCLATNCVRTEQHRSRHEVTLKSIPSSAAACAVQARGRKVHIPQPFQSLPSHLSLSPLDSDHSESSGFKPQGHPEGRPSCQCLRPLNFAKTPISTTLVYVRMRGDSSLAAAHRRGKLLLRPSPGCLKPSQSRG